MAKARKKTPMRSAPQRARAASPKPHLASIAVVVGDRRRSVRWYTETFGLDHLADMDHWQTVGEKGRPTVLHICQVSEYDDTAELEPGNSGIAFHLSGDFVAACAGLKARGVEFAVPPTKAEWGWWAMAKDPDGNELSLSPEE